MTKRREPDIALRTKFGQRARSLRNKLGIPQDVLGDRVGIDRTYIGSIERGEQNISLDNIARLAKGLEVSIQDLFDFS